MSDTNPSALRRMTLMHVTLNDMVAIARCITSIHQDTPKVSAPLHVDSARSLSNKGSLSDA